MNLLSASAWIAYVLGATVFTHYVRSGSLAVAQLYVKQALSLGDRHQIEQAYRLLGQRSLRYFERPWPARLGWASLLIATAILIFSLSTSLLQAWVQFCALVILIRLSVQDWTDLMLIERDIAMLGLVGLIGVLCVPGMSQSPQVVFLGWLVLFVLYAVALGLLRLASLFRNRDDAAGARLLGDGDDLLLIVLVLFFGCNVLWALTIALVLGLVLHPALGRITGRYPLVPTLTVGCAALFWVPWAASFDLNRLFLGLFTYLVGP